MLAMTRTTGTRIWPGRPGGSPITTSGRARPSSEVPKDSTRTLGVPAANASMNARTSANRPVSVNPLRSATLRGSSRWALTTAHATSDATPSHRSAVVGCMRITVTRRHQEGPGSLVLSAWCVPWSVVTPSPALSSLHVIGTGKEPRTKGPWDGPGTKHQGPSWRRILGATWRRSARDGQRANLPGARGFQDPRAFVERRSRRPHIVDQNHDAIDHVRLQHTTTNKRRYAEGATNVSTACECREPRLRRRGPDAPQRVYHGWTERA